MHSIQEASFFKKKTKLHLLSNVTQPGKQPAIVSQFKPTPPRKLLVWMVPVQKLFLKKNIFSPKNFY